MLYGMKWVVFAVIVIAVAGSLDLLVRWINYRERVRSERKPQGDVHFGGDREVKS